MCIRDSSRRGNLLVPVADTSERQLAEVSDGLAELRALTESEAASNDDVAEP